MGRQWANLVQEEFPMSISFPRPVVSALLCIVAVAGFAAASPAVFRQDERALQSVCFSNLKQYALGILMYVQDYDEKLPPMKLPAQVQNRINPYIKNRSVFSCPATKLDYLPNPALNYVSFQYIGSPSTMVMLRDAKPHTTDTGKPGWNVAYADGHVKLNLSEPKLGKPAPSPRPLTPAQQLSRELESLRRMRSNLDQRIRALEARQRRSRR